MQVSAGYDAHWRDPLASLQMRSSTYYRLAGRIKQLADQLSGGCMRCFLLPVQRVSPCNADTIEAVPAVLLVNAQLCSMHCVCMPELVVESGML